MPIHNNNLRKVGNVTFTKKNIRRKLSKHIFLIAPSTKILCQNLFIVFSATVLFIAEFFEKVSIIECSLYAPNDYIFVAQLP